MQMQAMISDTHRIIKSEHYNTVFRMSDGFFMRCGKTKEEDPEFSPFGPEILDLEISVNGCPNNCPFCYKGNSNEPATNMSFETFKNVIDKVAKTQTLSQVAFGITGVQTNPDFIKMLQYCREIKIVPNFTLSGIDLTDELAKEIAKYVGGLAVSIYQTDKNVGYDTVKKFTDLGIKQTNIHIMVSKETLPFVYEVIEDRMNDPRLAKMNAIVFLGLKQKGRATHYNPVSLKEYKDLVDHCISKGIGFGFDSCSAPKFEEYVNSSTLDSKTKERMLQVCEPCESGLFSSYINVHGKYYACSFAEEGEGLSVTECDDFLKDIWYHPQTIQWRKNLLAKCRNCPLYIVTSKEDTP